jgi:hypothetical protein
MVSAISGRRVQAVPATTFGLLAPVVVAAQRLAEEGRPPDGVTRTLVRCLIYVRISLDDKHDERACALSWTIWDGRAPELSESRRPDSTRGMQRGSRYRTGAVHLHQSLALHTS